MHIVSYIPPSVKAWWQSLDKPLLGLVFILCLIGIFTSLSVPGSNQNRINFTNVGIINIRFLFFAGVGICVFVMATAFSPTTIRRLCLVGIVAMFVVMWVMLPTIGIERNGATRWLSLAGLSLQPSEFLKPVFAIVSGWFLSARYSQGNIPGTGMSFALYMVFVVSLIIQPDFGQTLLLTAIWGGQVFMAGLAWASVFVLAVLLMIGLVVIYYFVPYVARRIDGFLNPDTVDTYQADRALDAFANGGFFGQGLGNGTIKYRLPDAHTDYIFAVYGEEGGLVIAALVLGVFVAIICRMFVLIYNQSDVFKRFAMLGISIQFAVQSFINIGATTSLLPSKGMTLPLVSMGGSSYVAMALGLGFFLALARLRKYEI